MKKYLVFFLFIFFCYSAFSQDTVNVRDSQGNKQGYWRRVDSLGNKIYEGHFRDNMPVGEFRYYYPNGKLKARSVMTENGTKSQFTSYFKNGFKMAEGVYIKEKRDGLWEFYSEYDGALVSEEHYCNGMMEGEAVNYYPGGEKSEIFQWKNGKKNGDWEQFYEDGKTKLKGMYLDDLREGPVEAFFLSGKKIFSGQYRNGNPDGTWIFFNEKEEVIRKEFYEKGLMIKVDTVGLVK